MKTFKVASDSSCLIALSQINLFHLLNELFLEIYIPPAVYDEVVIIGEGEAGSKETESAIKDGLILKKAVNDITAVSALTTTLGKGESEVIILCKELELDYALIDEKAARNIAELRGVNTMGVLGIIELAVEMGFSLDKKEIVKQLKDAGFRISDKLYKRMFLD